MCGLIGIIGAETSAAHAVEGLYAQQHRGREAAGVASADGMGVHLSGGLGEVEDVFPDGRDILRELPGMFAIGQVRYSTVAKDIRNSAVYQPIRGRYGNELFCIAHNGNITNAPELIEFVGWDKMTSSVDTEMVARLIERSYTGALEDDLSSVFCKLQGSYSFLLLFRNELIAVRDPRGCRPLQYGENGNLLVFASESCAFETLNVRTRGEVEPGTFIRVGAERTKRVIRFAPACEKKCSFEPVYFSHHAGDTFGISLMDFRLRLGEALEEECPERGAEIVLGVPDSAMVIAMGYGRSGRSGQYMPALTRHHHAGGRTFILPSQDRRDAAVRRKFQCSVSAIQGKSVVLVDDSIVRSTTMRLLVGRVRRAGAREIHVRSAFPPIRYSCRYGIDTPERKNLIAASHSVDEIRDFIKADSLAYLSEDTLLNILGGERSGWCTACINGRYWDY